MTSTNSTVVVIAETWVRADSGAAIEEDSTGTSLDQHTGYHL